MKLQALSRFLRDRSCY